MIVTFEGPVSTELAILIEAALGIEADMLVRMQTDYDMQVARNNRKIIKKFNEIRKLASLF